MEGAALIIALSGAALLAAVAGLKLLAAARAAPPGRRGRAALAQLGWMLLAAVLFVLAIAGIALVRIAVRFVARGGSLD